MSSDLAPGKKKGKSLVDSSKEKEKFELVRDGAMEATLNSDRFGSSKERKKFGSKIVICGTVGPVRPNATG